ncbi:hypothetical protein S40288_08424 [Stachybotrys chartarum IBT 40288]|nr:hypothetical protein S40288_08424 [Stachybotrys chartarum IBT 40288]
MLPQNNEKRLKIAIIGGGPAGLGAAIELAKLPFTDWKLYEKRPQLSEIGGGFSLQPQTWRLLERNGVARSLSADDYFRSADGHVEQRRHARPSNGRTGELLVVKYNPDDLASKHHSCRLIRAKLQSALLEHVDQTRIHLSKRLVHLEHLKNSQVKLIFADGTEDTVELVVAADGIRSCIRNFSFPDHKLQYSGQSVYRTIISKTAASKIDGIPWAPVFWKHVSGLYVYTCPLGNDDFEVTARIRRPQEHLEPTSWGQPFKLDFLLHEYKDFCLPIRQILSLAAEADTQEFALFSGPHLKQVTSSGSIAFVGDSSHAMLGNFGSGAGFALEDVYTLTRVLDRAWLKQESLSSALDLYSSIRSPHYERLYGVIERFTSIKVALRAERLGLDDEIAERIRRISQASESWMFHYRIDQAVDNALAKADETSLDAQKR